MATTENTGMTHHAVHVVVNVQRLTTRQESVLVKIFKKPLQNLEITNDTIIYPISSRPHV